MPSLSLQNSRNTLRAVLLYGVLAGLLFSCGEGIRLFPFPPEAGGRGENSRWNGGEAPVYQKNLHRFENKQGNPASKIQRDNHNLYWANASGAPDVAPHFSFSSLRASAVLPDSRIFKSRLSSFLGAGRAPPAQVLNFL